MICHQQGEELGKLTVLFSQNWKSWGRGDAVVDSMVWLKDVILNEPRNQEEEKMAVSAQAEWKSSPFLCIFILFKSSKDWVMPTYTGKDHLLSPIQVLISSGNTLTNAPRNNVLAATWASLSLVKRPLKLTIISPNVQSPASAFMFANVPLAKPSYMGKKPRFRGKEIRFTAWGDRQSHTAKEIMYRNWRTF